MDTESIKKIYSTYSKIYDFAFKSFLFPRHRYALNAMNINPEDKIIDVGVGTGMNLPLYPKYCFVTGIDLSSDMLKKAQNKVEKYNLSHINLKVMDASNLSFNDDTFDHAFLGFVISVVPDPVRVMSEIKRVTKKNGNIVILNHFQSSKKLIAKIEELISPFCKKIGFRSDLALKDIIGSVGLEIDYKCKFKEFDPWSIVFVKNRKP
jgi:phosphatidylethanolamine/phosphatidyl-N-methylethanolamine N-methyltransferase